MRLLLDLDSVEGYRTFLKIKALPLYRFEGREAWIPDEYGSLFGVKESRSLEREYAPSSFLFDYQAGISRIAIRKRKFAIFAQCVGGETVIHSPDGDVDMETACKNGKPIRVFSILDGKVVVAQGSAPFINGIDRLYRFTFASGRSIVATMGHRFLSSSGWKCGGSLQIGERLLTSDASLLQSTWDISRSRSPVGGRRSRETTQDYWGGCSAYFRRCGVLPHLQSNTDSTSVPSRAGARAHNYYSSQMGERQSKPARTRQRQYFVHPSTRHFLNRVGNSEAVAEYYFLSCDPEHRLWNSRIFQPIEINSILERLRHELHPLEGIRNADGQTDAVLECSPFATSRGCNCVNSDTYRRDHQSPILANTKHRVQSQESKLGDHVCRACKSPLVEWDALTAIQYIRTDVFYDIEVPGPANYLADGVWSHNCGVGKTLMMFEFIKHALSCLPKNKAALIVSPSMVIEQTMEELQRFHGGSLPIERVRARDLAQWLQSGSSRFGITNYESISEEITRPGRLGCLVLDESSSLKNATGKWGTRLIHLGKGLDWKLCLTGTPAPNDRIEYANHAVFLDHFVTVNSFLARYFINRGETANRWELKPHALRPFYRALSHWCIFLTNPAVYGWKDNTLPLPPIDVKMLPVPLTEDQWSKARAATGHMLGIPGGIGERGKVAQIAKSADGFKPQFIAKLAREKKVGTIIWCGYNEEQNELHRLLPEAANISGKTPEYERLELIRDFQTGRKDTLISKGSILGFGLNLQKCERMIFSTLQDSSEDYWQCIKRANRYGSTESLEVLIPATSIELTMINNVFRKLKIMEQDTREQESIFREESLGLLI